MFVGAVKTTLVREIPLPNREMASGRNLGPKKDMYIHLA
jgi:hypothetical protein